jgi:chromosome segregation ATPase
MAHSEANETIAQEDRKTVLDGSSQLPSSKPKRGQQKGGWFRRLLFVFLMLVVITGLVLAAVLLRTRLDAVLSKVDGLDAQLGDTQNDLSETQADLSKTQQELRDLAEESEAARAVLEQELSYALLLQQAQNEATKAIVSLTLDDVGQARREVTSLRASLVRATELAGETDAVTLSDLEARASGAEADLNTNTFASQQTLEVIWRELNELSAEFLAE